jgi:HlyD family secretion protein
MKYFKGKWTAAVALVLAIALFAAFSFGRGDSTQYFTSKVQKGDIHDVVEATGTINAVTNVQVGSQVSGTIAKLSADFNSQVKKGEVIALIDPSLFQGALLQARADLQTAQATAASAKADLAKAQAAAEQTQQDYARTVALARDGVFSQQQLDISKANNDAAKAALAAAQAQVNQALAQAKQKAAAVDVAQTNLDHTIIRAPIDGVVTARNVDVGQTVAASLQAPTLFNIAQDLTKMQVYAATDESDVGKMKVGQMASFKVDAFPKDTFTGRVSQVRMNPTTVQNVVTYNTIIDFDNPQQKLFPGMTAYVSIPVASATDVIKVPDGALRFTPELKPDEARQMAQKYGVRVAAKSSGVLPSAQMQQAEAHQSSTDTAVVWKLTSAKKLEPVRIRTGITDHTFTEVAQVLKGELQPGDQLVIGSSTGSMKASAGSSAPLGAGARMGR